MTTRGWLLRLHRWLGLTAGAVFAIAAVSGAVLVYADELNVLLSGPSVPTTPGRLGAAELQSRIEGQLPGARIVRVIWPSDGPNVLNVRALDNGRSRDFVFDAGSGALLRPRSQHWLLTTVRRVHAGLLLGPVGGVVVQLASWLAIVSFSAGLYLWWPGWRQLASGLRLRIGRGLLVSSLDLHQTPGVLVLPFLVTMALTGVLINPAALNVVSSLLNLSDPGWQALRSAPADPSAPDIDLTTALRVIAREAGSDRVTHIEFPSAENGVVDARVAAPDGTMRVALDRHTGAVRGRQPVRYDGPINAALHFGTAGGQILKAAYAVSCLVGSTLFVTGSIIWWIRRSRRADRSAGRTA
jgi:uncharacterized iron-regulated membrane protein